MKKLCGIILVASSISCMTFAGEANVQPDQHLVGLASGTESAGDDKVQKPYSEIMDFYHSKIESNVYALLAEKEAVLAQRYTSEFNAMMAAKLATILSQSNHFSFAFPQ